LGDHAAQGAGNQVGMNAKVFQGSDRTWRVHGVQRAKELLASEGRPHRHYGGLYVADFPDHQNVGVLMEYGTQTTRKRQPRLDIDFDLIDAGKLVFDRIFDNDDIVGENIHLVQPES
jgi:hypothetical protein